MVEKYYRFRVNFVKTYIVEVSSRNSEEAKEKAKDIATDRFSKNWDIGEIDPSYFAVKVEEDE